MNKSFMLLKVPAYADIDYVYSKYIDVILEHFDDGTTHGFQIVGGKHENSFSSGYAIVIPVLEGVVSVIHLTSLHFNTTIIPNSTLKGEQQFSQSVISSAVNNTYKVLEREPSIKEYNNMLRYFESTEQYEICSFIKNTFLQNVD